MDFKPQNFFIGVVDFFSVLLPGALLTYFLMGMFYDSFFGIGKTFPAPTDITVKWIIFLLITYTIGNIIYMLSSFLDASYNKTLRKKLFQSPYDLSYKTARSIHSKYVNVDASLMELSEQKLLTQDQFKNILSNPKREIFNTFKWAKHFLLFNKPEALTDIKRTEADSKFFRSLVITFLIMAFMLLIKGNFIEPLIFIFLSALCYYRYGDLRFKATEMAYEMIITYYYLNPEQNQLGSAVTLNSSTIKTDLDKAFELKYHKRISSLIKGFDNPPKYLTINKDESGNVLRTADNNEWWYCIEGIGKINIEGKGTHFFQSNGIVPIVKGMKFTLQNKNQKPLQLLVFNQ